MMAINILVVKGVPRWLVEFKSHVAISTGTATSDRAVSLRTDESPENLNVSQDHIIDGPVQ